MIKKKVFFYVQHLHGLGHVYRAIRIANALHSKGFEVHLIWGGRKVESLDTNNLNPVYLPPVYCNVNDFTALLDENYQPVSSDYLGHRKSMLLESYLKISPDVVITETFPFGRRQMRFELLPLMDLIQKQRKSGQDVKVVASVRDIVQQNRKAASHQDTLNYLNTYFDIILVHADSNFVQLEETVPGVEKYEKKIYYTGIVAPKNNLVDSTLISPPEVLVSGGGGAAAFKLIKTAIDSAPLSKKFKKSWTITTGPYMSDEDFKILKKSCTPQVTLVRFIENFYDLVKKAKVSISLTGYNTVADILSAKIPSIVIPSNAGKETEQLFRAHKLDKLGWAKMIHPDELTAEKLSYELDNIDQLKKINFNINLDGAENSANILFNIYNN